MLEGGADGMYRMMLYVGRCGSAIKRQSYRLGVPAQSEEMGACTETVRRESLEGFVRCKRVALRCPRSHGCVQCRLA